MKLKMLDIVNLSKNIHALLDQKVPVQVSLKLMRLEKDLYKEVDLYNEALGKIKEDEDGAQEKYVELLESESGVDFEKIPLADLGDITLSARELAALGCVVDFGEDEDAD